MNILLHLETIPKSIPFPRASQPLPKSSPAATISKSIPTATNSKIHTFQEHPNRYHFQEQSNRYPTFIVQPHNFFRLPCASVNERMAQANKESQARVACKRYETKRSGPDCWSAGRQERTRTHRVYMYTSWKTEGGPR